MRAGDRRAGVLLVRFLLSRQRGGYKSKSTQQCNNDPGFMVSFSRNLPWQKDIKRTDAARTNEIVWSSLPRAPGTSNSLCQAGFRMLFARRLEARTTEFWCEQRAFLKAAILGLSQLERSVAAVFAIILAVLIDRRKRRRRKSEVREIAAAHHRNVFGDRVRHLESRASFPMPQDH